MSCGEATRAEAKSTVSLDASFQAASTPQMSWPLTIRNTMGICSRGMLQEDTQSIMQAPLPHENFHALCDLPRGHSEHDVGQKLLKCTEWSNSVKITSCSLLSRTKTFVTVRS
jgi:hypothetical protein